MQDSPKSPCTLVSRLLSAGLRRRRDAFRPGAVADPDDFVLPVSVQGGRMVRESLLIMVCCFLVSACGRSPEALVTGPMDLKADLVPPGAAAQQFSYSHFWALVMDKSAVAPRLERARLQCLQDKE